MKHLLRFAALGFFALGLGYPLAEVAVRATGAFAPEFFGVVGGALVQALASAGISLVLGVSLGVFYARAWHRWLRPLASLAFSIPSVFVVAFAQSALAGTEFRTGLVAVVAAHAYLNVPWIALATAEGIREVSPEWIRAARTLGATPAQVGRRIVLPQALRRIGFAFAQVFALCLGSFAIVLVLGGGPGVTSLETEIYASVRGGSLAIGNAAHYALAQLVLASVPLWIVLARDAREPIRDHLSARTESTVDDRRPSVVLAVLLAAAWIAAPAVVFARELDADVFARVFGDAELGPALATSARIALFAALFVLVFGAGLAAAARGSRMLRFLAALPVGLSPLVLSLGFFLAYSRFVDPFEGSELGMVVVQGLLFLPFAMRFFLPVIETESTGPRRDLRSAARTLGAPAWRAWIRFELPRWRAASIRLKGLVLVWSFSEVAAASFFGSEKLVTIGRLLLGWFARYRFADANLVLFGMYGVAIATLLAAERFARDEESGRATR